MSPSDGTSPPLSAAGANPFRRNWYVFASLATVLILTPAAIAATREPTIGVGTSLVGVVLAQFALATSKAAGRPLRKTSIWAMTLNFVMLPVWILLIPVVFTVLDGGKPGDVRLDALVAGDCIQSLDGLNTDRGLKTSDPVSRVACDEPHWGQVYFTTELAPGDFPGDDKVLAMSNDACYSAAAVSTILPSKLDSAWPLVLSPTRSSWGNFNRTVTCVAFAADGSQITGTLLVTG